MNFENLKKCMDEHVSHEHRPSVDVLVYRNHEPIYRYFTGVMDIEKGGEIKGDEQYFIYSMTKMITCCCALQLLEQGKYNLDDPISKWLPEFSKMKITAEALNTENAVKIASGQTAGESVDVQDDGYAKTPITVKHLFTMTAGLDYALYDDVMKKAAADGKKTTQELVRAMAGKTLGFEPGSRFRYSLCHDVLGALVEIWSGDSLGEYMRKNIFEPLGMKNTYFGLPQDISKMPSLYCKYENQPFRKQDLTCVYNLSDQYESGGAGLTSNTEDYALFLDMVACGGVGKTGNRILKEETVKLWGSNHVSGQAADDFDVMRRGYGYGLGVRVHTDPTRSNTISPVGEFGWDGAAGAFAMVDPVNNISLTYFQNVLGFAPDQCAIRNALYKDLGL
ncbi:MAG: beta-lactamase family protein [Clostridia bacterium]|nr:beta-lactamase family protein [Clostridia bacterium]